MSDTPKFVYLLNALEMAARKPMPSEHGYAGHRAKALDYVAQLEAKVDALMREKEELRGALQQLLTLKDTKERIEWLSDAAKRGRLTDNESEELEVSMAEYNRLKPLMWAAARKAIRSLVREQNK